MTLTVVPFEDHVTCNTPFIINDLCYTFPPESEYARRHRSLFLCLSLPYCSKLQIQISIHHPLPKMWRQWRLYNGIIKDNALFSHRWYFDSQIFFNNTDKSCQAIRDHCQSCYQWGGGNFLQNPFSLSYISPRIVFLSLIWWRKRKKQTIPGSHQETCLILAEGAINIQHTPIHCKVRLAV